MGVRDRIPRMRARFADLVEERARCERARKVIERWNHELVASDLPLWSPSIRAALIAGMPWLEVLCPACATVGVVNLSVIDRHPEAGVASLVIGLTCSRCGPYAPIPRLLGLHASRSAGLCQQRSDFAVKPPRNRP
jgi:hypothetical protein